MVRHDCTGSARRPGHGTRMNTKQPQQHIRITSRVRAAPGRTAPPRRQCLPPTRRVKPPRLEPGSTLPAAVAPPRSKALVRIPLPAAVRAADNGLIDKPAPLRPLAAGGRLTLNT
eukprot:6853045-Prymnesium_polylepis.1